MIRGLCTMYEVFIGAFPRVWWNKGTCSFIFREQGNICKYFKGTKLILGNKEILKITFRGQGTCTVIFREHGISWKGLFLVGLLCTDLGSAYIQIIL